MLVLNRLHGYLKNPSTEAITLSADVYEWTSVQLESSNREALSQSILSVPEALNLAYATRDPCLYISIWTCKKYNSLKTKFYKNKITDFEIIVL